MPWPIFDIVVDRPHKVLVTSLFGEFVRRSGLGLGCRARV